MTKSEMIKNTALYDGVGVTVVQKNTGDISYYFYENFNADKGCDRAIRHFAGRNVLLMFTTQTEARNTLFKEEAVVYKKLKEEANIAEMQYFANPLNYTIEEHAEKTYIRSVNALHTLCRRLMQWTNCSFEYAKKVVEREVA